MNSVQNGTGSVNEFTGGRVTKNSPGLLQEPERAVFEATLHLKIRRGVALPASSAGGASGGIRKAPMSRRVFFDIVQWYS